MNTRNRKDRAKSANRIEEVLAELGVELVAKGRNLMALCPVHDDTNPSFSVRANQQDFKCFGCNVRGDVIEAVKVIRGCDFKEALRFLEKIAHGKDIVPCRQTR